MEAPQRALVVTDDLERAATWMGWCRGAGYTTAGCAGPGLVLDCPRGHGARCVLREVADVAIVDLSCDDDADLCTKIPRDGSTIFLRRESPSEPGHRELMDSVDAAQRHVASLSVTRGRRAISGPEPCAPLGGSIGVARTAILEEIAADG
jgi:hypothetical protein